MNITKQSKTITRAGEDDPHREVGIAIKWTQNIVTKRWKMDVKYVGCDGLEAITFIEIAKDMVKEDVRK